MIPDGTQTRDMSTSSNDSDTEKAKQPQIESSITIITNNMKSILTLLLTSISSSIVAQTTYPEANYNVVVERAASRLELFAEYPLAIIENFDAVRVDIHRNVRSGYNTFYLPFFVNADEILSNGGNTYVYAEQDDSSVSFELQQGIDANIPFLMTEVTATDVLTFANKGVVQTPAASSSADFAGNYDGTISAEGKWGIGSADKFVRGSSKATIRSFAAFLSNPPAGPSNAKSIVLHDDVTGISQVIADGGEKPMADAVYDLSGRMVAPDCQSAKGRLQKGIYIVNGKKRIIR